MLSFTEDQVIFRETCRKFNTSEAAPPFSRAGVSHVRRLASTYSPVIQSPRICRSIGRSNNLNEGERVNHEDESWSIGRT